jgi:hypothetical protein
MLINILQWGAMVVDSMQVRGAVLSDQQGWRIREIIIVVVIESRLFEPISVFLMKTKSTKSTDFRKYVIGPSIFLENTTCRVLLLQHSAFLPKLPTTKVKTRERRIRFIHF